MQYKVDGQVIGFNEKWSASVTEDVFIEENKHHGLTTQQLKETYKLIMEKHGNNSGVQKKSTKLKPQRGGASVTGPDKTVALDVQQGTDAGGEAQGR